MRGMMLDAAMAAFLASVGAAEAQGPVQPFARDELCALLRPGLEVESAGLRAAMLSAGTTLATSTPRSDPSGD